MPGTLGPLALVSKYGREQSLVPLCHRIAADPGWLQIKLIDQYKHTLDAGAHGTYRHGGPTDVDDVFIDPDRIKNGLALILSIKSLLPNFAATRFAKHE